MAKKPNFLIICKTFKSDITNTNMFKKFMLHLLHKYNIHKCKEIIENVHIILHVSSMHQKLKTNINQSNIMYMVNALNICRNVQYQYRLGHPI